MKRLIMWAVSAVLSTTLVACSTSQPLPPQQPQPKSQPQARIQAKSPAKKPVVVKKPRRVKSEIPGQLDDGGWVMNIPGKPHVHRVVLESCADKPQVIKHVHTREQTQAKGPHKHNGCFVCPPPNPNIKRIH